MTSKTSLSGIPDVWSRIASLRQNSPDLVAPAMRAAIIATLKHAQGETVTVTLGAGRVDTIALDPVVHETLRSDELQQIYFEQGTTQARTAIESWHFYGLASDLISIEYGWFDDAVSKSRWPLDSDRAIVCHAWFEGIAAIAKRFQLAAGIDWPHHPDAPHLQWGRCARSPYEAPRIYAKNGGGDRGRQAVWKAVGALVVPAELAAASA